MKIFTKVLQKCCPASPIFVKIDAMKATPYAGAYRQLYPNFSHFLCDIREILRKCSALMLFSICQSRDIARESDHIDNSATAGMAL